MYGKDIIRQIPQHKISPVQASVAPVKEGEILLVAQQLLHSCLSYTHPATHSKPAWLPCYTNHLVYWKECKAWGEKQIGILCLKFSLYLHCILTSIAGQFSCSISSYYTVFCPICLIALLSFPPKINLDSLFPIILALFDTVNLDYSKLCCSETDHLHVSQGNFLLTHTLAKDGKIKTIEKHIYTP